MKKKPPGRLTKNYAARLVRLALEDPGRLTREEKFWKVEFFPVYLRRAEQLIWHEPERALPFLEPAPAFAARLADAHPRENAADFMILAHSYLGNAHRRLSHTRQAQEQFDRAGAYRDSASPAALAKYYRYYAMLCIHQKRPQAFELLNEAITIYKRGNLVHRHQLGECLVLRGIAYYEFKQHDLVLGDFTAALSHLSLQEDPTSYYCALHNLASYAVRHGSEDDVREALENLKPARSLLATQTRHNYAKIGMRWLFGLLAFRLGHDADAELKLREVSKAFRRLKLPFEIGCVQLDLARLYLRQGRREAVRRIARQTARTFRDLGNDARAAEALDLWRLAFRQEVTDQHLLDTRERFFGRKQSMAA